MNAQSLPASRLFPWHTVLVAGVLVCGLSACGGEVDSPPAPGTAAAASTAATTATRVPLAVAEPLAPLLADDGSALPSSPRSVPQDPGARTRAGRYATAAQAAQLEQTLGNRVLSVNIGCCGIEAADQAVAIAHGLQAAHDLPRSAPVLVRGADQRLAAAVANRLADDGHTLVWLVTR